MPLMFWPFSLCWGCARFEADLPCFYAWWLGDGYVARQQFSNLDQETEFTVVHCKWNTITIEENATIQAPKVAYLYPACHGPLQGERFLCRLKCIHADFGLWWKVWLSVSGRDPEWYTCCTQGFFWNPSAAAWPSCLIPGASGWMLTNHRWHISWRVWIWGRSEESTAKLIIYYY
jgi:hypothetical protein